MKIAIGMAWPTHATKSEATILAFTPMTMDTAQLKSQIQQYLVESGNYELYDKIL